MADYKKKYKALKKLVAELYATIENLNAKKKSAPAAEKTVAREAPKKAVKKAVKKVVKKVAKKG